MGGFEYFAERQGVREEQTVEEIGERFWGGVVAAVEARLADGSFAEDFPQRCGEYPVIVDASWDAFRQALLAEHRAITWPLSTAQVPPTVAALEAIEFFHLHVSKVSERTWHDYYRHHHLRTFDRPEGRREFRELINRLFRRNRLAYELTDEGEVRRLVQGPLGTILSAGIFNTGDVELDRLLRQARDRFVDPDLEVRRDSLEKLWDAWERAKTLLDQDKQKGVQELLRTAVADGEFRSLLNADGRSLTDVGMRS
jgi:hypothetical protein